MRLVTFLVLLISSSFNIDASEAKDKFVGTWTLQKIQALDEAGHWRSVTDRFDIGYLMYDSAGNMAVQLMRRDRPRFASDNMGDVTVDELEAYCGNQPLGPCLGYGGYFGTFDVDEKEGSVTHHLIGHISPNQVGTDAKRFYKFEGDTLTLMPARDRLLIWKRLR
jgi:hypothetical protein